ncbi:MAG: hypothetical protein U9Q62_00570 [Campylobacterota bacterium]|nr:hypothetical protein [Campylobacterota bacterium]
MSIRLISAPISLQYSLLCENEEGFEREYHQLSESDEDPIGQWLKLAKGRGEMAETDPVLLNLLIELHRKVDNLERLIKEEEPARVALSSLGDIERIGYGFFQMKSALFQKGQSYYGRIEMPVHPKRDIGVFFSAEDERLARVTKMHSRDEKEWGSYLTARERVMIREMKGS